MWGGAHNRPGAVASAVLVLLFSWSARSDVIHVPGDYLTIQEAVDAASPGDTVLVAPGIYLHSEVREVAEMGRVAANVFLKSGVAVVGAGPATRIEGNNEGLEADFKFVILAYEVERASLGGFTITGHQHQDPHWQYAGPGLKAVRSRMTIEKNVFDCYIPPGGCQYLYPAVTLADSDVQFRKNVIFYGEDCSLVSLYGDRSRIYNNTFYGDSDCVGVAVDYGATPLVVNNIFAGLWIGIGAYNGGMPRTLMTNCFWNVDIPYEACGPGIKDVFQDPRFAREPQGNDYDFHLRPGSPCIDAGTDIGLPFFDAPDIGRYEFCPYPLLPDNRGAGPEA